jgi:hypothetical protein
MTDAISIGIAILSIALAVLFYFRTRRVKKPVWSVRTTNLVTDRSARLPLLSVLYEGKSVQNLSISRVLFWNSGQDTIRQSDIASTDPLRIRIQGGAQLLDIQVLEVNCEANQVSVQRNADDKSALLNFEFLDPGQGAVFQLVHSGTKSEDIVVTGILQGAGKPRRRETKVTGYLPLPTPRSFDEKLRPLTRRRIGLCLRLLVFTALFSPAIVTAAIDGVRNGFNNRIWIFSVIYGLVVAMEILDYQRTGAPRGLDSFEGSM